MKRLALFVLAMGSLSGMQWRLGDLLAVTALAQKGNAAGKKIKFDVKSGSELGVLLLTTVTIVPGAMQSLELSLEGPDQVMIDMSDHPLFKSLPGILSRIPVARAATLDVAGGCLNPSIILYGAHSSLRDLHWHVRETKEDLIVKFYILKKSRILSERH